MAVRIGFSLAVLALLCASSAYAAVTPLLHHLRFGASHVSGVSTVGQSPTIPNLPEQFTTNLTQVVEPSGKITLMERLIWDRVNQRSRATFGGPEFPDPITQISRFDLGLLYQFSTVQGKATNCRVQNMTGSLPVFFSFPANSSFTGARRVNGVQANCWSYWSRGTEYAFCSTAASATTTAAPVQVSQLSGNQWADNYYAFVAGQPPLSDFELPASLKCVSGN